MTVIECKDYSNGSVPIDDVEEFTSKLSQIAGHNVKGLLVSSCPLSETGLIYAKNKGVGVVRIIDEKIHFDIYRKYRFGVGHIYENARRIICGLENPTKQHYIFDKYQFEDIDSYLIELQVIDKKEKLKNIVKAPYIPDDEITKTVAAIVSKDCFNTVQATPLDYIITNMPTTLGVNFILDEDLGFSGSKEILGKVSFKDNLLYVSSHLKYDSHRWRFTFAHELGHFLLHSKCLSVYDEAIDIESTFNNEVTISEKSLKIIEYQANQFAKHLLLPEKPFKAAALVAFQKYNVNKGRIFFDHQPCNRDLFYSVARFISNIFNVSIEAVKYRLMHFGFLEVKEYLEVRR